MSSVLSESTQAGIMSKENLSELGDLGDHDKENNTARQKQGSLTWKISCGSCTKTIVMEGEGFLRPALESSCTIDIHQVTEAEESSEIHTKDCLLQDIEIPDGDNIEMMIGSAESWGMRALEQCLLTMRNGEECKFSLHIQNSMSVTFRVKLHSFTETKPLWELTAEEKYNLALIHKEKGTHLFKDDKIKAAFYQYSVAIKYLICIPDYSSVMDDDPEMPPETQRVADNALRCICYLNLAACQLKVGNYQGVIDNCTHALATESGNVKGLYRRAQAYKAVNKLEEARSDLIKAMKLEPQNRAVAALLQSCKS